MAFRILNLMENIFLFVYREKFIILTDAAHLVGPEWTSFPLEENTERPNKGLDQPKTKEEVVDRVKGLMSTTTYAEWAPPS